MNWLAAGLVCVVGSAAVLIAGCESEAGGSPPPPPTVEVATPTTQQVTDYFQYTGFLEAMEQVDIRARVPGFLESVDFEESSAVEAGQVLFTIEKEPYEVAVGRARADLARAESALSLAEANRARTQQAFDADAANELELIADEAAVKQAEAEVLAAEQMLEGAELDLSYTDVVTPLSGRVDRNYVDVGNLVGVRRRHCSRALSCSTQFVSRST
ncbi:MAG: efflux RND transporter periplasmic adaptor subunit [Planctomycetota bacterium]